MNHDDKRIAAARRQIEAGNHELASDLAAEFEERAAAVKRERLGHRRRFIVWCSLAAGLGLAGTILVATTKAPPTRTHQAPRLTPATGTTSGASTPVASPAPPRLPREPLPEEDRRAIFRAIVLAEDRSELERQRITPHGGRLTPRERLQRAKRHHAKFEQLAEQRRRELDDELALRYGVTREQIAEIEREGVLRDWGYEIPAPAGVKRLASRHRAAVARGPGPASLARAAPTQSP